LFIGRFKNTAFCGRKQDESEKFLALTIFDFLVMLKLRKETMAHLTPKEILSRAEEFLQCADYAVQNDNF
jgi:hypothetical protein